MAVNSFFVSPTLGMLSHAQALNTIGVNVANVTTGGYRKVQTHFSTVLSETIQYESDLGGVRPRDINRISGQGQLISSDSNLDLAINGRGFFILKRPDGKLVYGRDGTFEQGSSGATSNVAGLPLSDGTPQTLSVKQGFLVDKNGFFVQGFAPDTNGNFPTTGGTLQNLRIDPFAFASVGEATTAADLDLNIPATDEAVSPQVDRVALAGVIEAGDKYSVTVDGTTVEITLAGTEPDINAVRDALITAINANATVAAVVTASAAGGDGNVILTAKKLSTAFTATSAGTNGSLTNDNVATQSTLQTAKLNEFTRTFDFQIFDSGGVAQNIRLNFNKRDTNTWEVTTTVSQTTVAQVDTVTIAGTVEAGDKYTVNVNGNALVYTVVGNEGSLDGVRNAIVNAINADTTLNQIVTAANGAAGQLTVTSKTAGTALTTTVAAANNAGAVAQVDTVSLTVPGGGTDLGDQFTVTVNGFATLVTPPAASNLAATRTAIINAINANPAVNATITAAAGAGAADITLTAAAVGVPFTTTVLLPVDNGTANTIGVSTTTIGATTTADNTVTTATTTANKESTVTSTTPDTLVFNANGLLSTPTTKSINYALTFAGGNTGTFALDIAGLTQFAGDFTPIRFNKNGFAKADMISTTFDNNGQILGTFSDGTARAIYKVPLASFSNPDALDSLNGNVFSESVNSGPAKVIIGGIDNGVQFLPNTRELSNVVLAEEFTAMIRTQHAYNSSATVFRTVDEMMETARDLKR